MAECFIAFLLSWVGFGLILKIGVSTPMGIGIIFIYAAMLLISLGGAIGQVFYYRRRVHSSWMLALAWFSFWMALEMMLFFVGRSSEAKLSASGVFWTLGVVACGASWVVLAVLTQRRARRHPVPSPLVGEG